MAQSKSVKPAVKQSAHTPPSQAALNTLYAVGGASRGGLYGALLGALGGGAYGAYDPGGYVGLDKGGNPVLKRRNRLMGALQNILPGLRTGFAAGALTGAGYGYATAPSADQVSISPPPPPPFPAMTQNPTSWKKASALQKQAGPVSEMAAVFNPLNAMGGGALGGLAALATPTRSLKQQAEFDSNDSMLRALTNVLVPGVGAYRGFKRTGAGIRSPEMKAIKSRRLQDQARRELESMESAHGADKKDDSGKEAGWKTEIAGAALNPLNVVGNPLGALAALATPTRSLNQQSEADDSTWSNIFIPGAGAYNMFKRTGAVTRSPEMRAMQQRATIERLQREARGPSQADARKDKSEEKEASAFKFGAKVAFKLSPEVMQGGLGGAALGAGIGGLAGLISPGEDENGKKRNRLSAALSGALGGAGVGGLAGGAAGLFAPDMVRNYGAQLGQMFRRPTTAPALGQVPMRNPMKSPADYVQPGAATNVNAAMGKMQQDPLGLDTTQLPAGSAYSRLSDAPTTLPAMSFGQEVAKLKQLPPGGGPAQSPLSAAPAYKPPQTQRQLAAAEQAAAQNAAFQQRIRMMYPGISEEEVNAALASGAIR